MLKETFNEKPSAFRITEIWLKDEQTNSVYESSDYHNIQTISLKKRGAGVAIYIRDDLSYQIISQTTLNPAQIFTLQIKAKIKTYFITCLHIPPSSINKQTLSKLESHLETSIIFPDATHKIIAAASRETVEEPRNKMLSCQTICMVQFEIAKYKNTDTWSK